MMSLWSLLIETIQSFRRGLPTTHGPELARLRELEKSEQVPTWAHLPPGMKVNSEGTFKSFFQDFKDEFPGMDGSAFHKNVRCGLLHQAQTKWGWTITASRRQHELVIDEKIQRNLFAKTLQRAFERYLHELGDGDWDSEAWKNARRKIWWLIRLSR